MVERLHSEDAKIGNYRVDYNSTRSAAPKSGGGAAPAVAVAGYSSHSLNKFNEREYNPTYACNKLATV